MPQQAVQTQTQQQPTQQLRPQTRPQASRERFPQRTSQTSQERGQRPSQPSQERGQSPSQVSQVRASQRSSQSQQQQERVQRPSQQQERAQRTSQSQGQADTVLEILHKSGGKFKKLALVLPPGGGVILRLSESAEGNVRSIAFALNRTELITLSKELEFFLMGVVKPTPNNNGRTPLVEFFHMGKNGQYKKLAVEFGDGGLFLTLKQGERGLVPDAITFALSRAEAIHLEEELRLLFVYTRAYLVEEL